MEMEGSIQSLNSKTWKYFSFNQKYIAHFTIYVCIQSCFEFLHFLGLGQDEKYSKFSEQAFIRREPH